MGAPFFIVRVRVQAGQNGYRIVTENNIPFETVEKEFESREHALNWIIENQLGRRNLNSNQIAYLRGKRYEMEKKIWGGTGANQYSKEQSSQNDNSAKLLKTNENLAKHFFICRSLHYTQKTDMTEKII